MADQKQQLTAAGCPPELAEKLATAKVGAPRVPGQPTVGGLFGNLQFLRKLAAFLQQDGETIRAVVQAVVTASQAGNWLDLVNLAQTQGPVVWQVVQDLVDLFSTTPAPTGA